MDGTKNNTMQYINSAIAVAIMLFFRFIPAPAPIEPMGMNILGIFIGAIYAWCTVSLIWPSILALTLLGLSGYCTVQQAYATAAGNNTVLLALLMMIFTSIIGESGLTDWLSNWMITRKIAVGRPWVLSFMLLMAAYVATVLVDSVPAILICWGFVYAICQQIGYRPRDSYPMIMVVGIVYASIMGFGFFPFKIAVVANYGFLSSAMGVEAVYSYSAYMLFSMIFGLLCVVMYILMAKFILRPDVSLLKNADIYTIAGERKPLDGKQKITVVLLGVLIVILLLPSFLPATTFLGSLLTKIGTTGLVGIMIGITIFINYQGKPFAQFKTMVYQGVSWDLVIMIAAALTLAGGLTSDLSGIKPMLMEMILPILGGKSAFVFCAVFMIVALVLTNLINNIVVSAIMIPILYTFSLEMDFNPIAMVAVFIYVCNMAILLPSSSPSGAMIHGNREWISGGNAIKYGLIAMVLTAILAVIVGIPLAEILF